MGIISPLGSGVAETLSALAGGLSGISPLTLFPTPGNLPLPVGQVKYPLAADPSIPRTHQIARIAADQAMADCREVVDIVVVGTTTGGMHTTEHLLKTQNDNPGAYRYHSAGSVAEDLAARYGCKGAALTVSTACSSGAVAIKIALEMLRTGRARLALAGGADSLCRLTYHGFNTLQLIDPQGARPLDKTRRGMSVAEGAAMLLLVAGDAGNAVAEILGAGLSCDAFHPTAPHPEGQGAYSAMIAALGDAGLAGSEIDYINLHGTGTPDNDLAEARAVKRLLGDSPVLVSSVKGSVGHPLAAAGAIEAVIAVIAIRENLVPANTGCSLPDPELKLTPVITPQRKRVRTVLSNSFGFGGNNAAVVIGHSAARQIPAQPPPGPMSVIGSACVTGAGDTDRTWSQMSAGASCQGVVSVDQLSNHLDPRGVRRLRWLPRVAMALAHEAHLRSGDTPPPSSVFFGTGLGAMSETYGFLTNLYESGERFSSPTDFVGSVHNGPAGHVAVMFGATGPNVTMTGGDYSFEQALLTACYLGREKGKSALVIGADEYHEKLSRLFDPSVLRGDIPSAGGAALLLSSASTAPGVTVFPAFHGVADTNLDVVAALVQCLGGPKRIQTRFGVLLAGIPAAYRQEGTAQLAAFLSCSGLREPVIEYRRLTGEFSSASAVATFMAVRFTQESVVPGPLCSGRAIRLAGKGCLVIGFGKCVTAIEVALR
jgi:3-oxoacyl-[acyl-carrier-protein] synthase-1/3-oxoacyl-[acyl-carrier-protein] synthase II